MAGQTTAKIIASAILLTMSLVHTVTLVHVPGVSTEQVAAPTDIEEIKDVVEEWAILSYFCTSIKNSIATDLDTMANRTEAVRVSRAIFAADTQSVSDSAKKSATPLNQSECGRIYRYERDINESFANVKNYLWPGGWFDKSKIPYPEDANCTTTTRVIKTAIDCRSQSLKFV